MKLLLTATLLACCATAAAQTQAPTPSAGPWVHPLLWRIEGPKPSFLVGTMHFPDARCAVLPASLEDALSKSEVVVTEVIIGLVAGFKMGMRTQLQDGRLLDQLLPPKTLERLQRQLAAHQLPWWRIRTTKIWAVLQTLESQLLEMNGPMLDLALQEWAGRHGKPSEALETIEEQLDVFDGLTFAEQIEQLDETLDEMESGRAVRELTELRDSFFSGDAERVRRALDSSNDKRSPVDLKLERLVFTERNIRMTDRIRAQLGDGKARLWAVGAGHLVSKDGIVARLRQAGFTVTRLDPPPSVRPTPAPTRPRKRSTVSGGTR
jgi:uncharacterized protein YbaP (TraB family)